MILKNGKRIDGCTDTLPIGTVQPFLGLTPPKGYLVCQGQLVSKTTYPELYAICGDLFGTATETDFYLPDLRGKTIAGYDENDTAMNTIGKLLGQKTHIHTTGNHTLTIDEMPTHYHDIVGSYNSNAGLNLATSNNGDGTTGYMTYSPVHPTGGSQAHNHGDTGEASNYQPTVVMNWIVKAAMLIPEYFTVKNVLDSDSTSDALSAAQGKFLNESKLSLAGGTMSGRITLSEDGLETNHEAGVIVDKYGNLRHKRNADQGSNDVWCIANNADTMSLQYKFEAGDLAVPNELYIRGIKATPVPQYNFSIHNQYYCFGTFEMAQAGCYVLVDVCTGFGYNGSNGQERRFSIVVRTGNGSPSAFVGYVEDNSCYADAPGIRLVQNSDTNISLWMTPINYTGHSFFTVRCSNNASFTFSGAQTSNDVGGSTLEVKSVPRVYSGAGAPGSSTGKNGDIYIRTS